MGNNETVLENELDNTEVTEAEAVDEQEVGEDADDEFDYDDEGDIIIPDFDEDPEEEPEEEDPDDADETESEEEDAGEDESTDEEPTDKTDTETETVLDPRDAELARLRAELEAIKSQGKDTLKKLGSESEDVIEGLAALAAEAQGLKPEEYKVQRDAQLREEAQRNAMRSQMFEQKAASDLAELHAAYPETAKYKHIKDLPADIRRKFGSFRDKGLSAKEAYAAANPDGIRRDTENAVKKQAAHKSKEHLRSSVPKTSKDNSVRMSKAELGQWREIFPDKSDAELEKLYKQTL